MTCALTWPAHQAQATLITFDDLAATVTSEVWVGKNVTFSGYRAVFPGVYSSSHPLVISSGGVTVTITRPDGALFDLTDNVTLVSQQGKDPSFGSRSIIPTGSASASGFIVSFSDPVRGFSLLAGDYGLDEDSLKLTAYYGENLTGGQVAVGPVSDTMAGNLTHDWTQKRITLTVGGTDDPESPDYLPGFQSILFQSIGNYNALSVFLDRLWFERDPYVIQELTDNPTDYFDELDNPSYSGDQTSVVPEPAGVTLLVLGAYAMTMRRRARR